MSQRMSRLHMRLAPTLALLRRKCSLVPRVRVREFKTPSPARGGRLGWGRNRKPVTPDLALTLTFPCLRGRECERVRMDEVIR